MASLKVRFRPSGSSSVRRLFLPVSLSPLSSLSRAGPNSKERSKFLKIINPDSQLEQGSSPLLAGGVSAIIIDENNSPAVVFCDIYRPVKKAMVKRDDFSARPE